MTEFVVGTVESLGRLDFIPTVTASSAYTAGNSVGGLTTLTLPQTASGLIQSVSVIVVSGDVNPLSIYIFDANPTSSTFTDKATFSIATADISKLVNKTAVTLTPAVGTGVTFSTATLDGYAKPFALVGKLYVALTTSGTPTYASITDVRVALNYAQTNILNGGD